MKAPNPSPRSSPLTAGPFFFEEAAYKALFEPVYAKLAAWDAKLILIDVCSLIAYTGDIEWEILPTARSFMSNTNKTISPADFYSGIMD